MDVHTSLGGQCQDTGHLVGPEVPALSMLYVTSLADATVERRRAFQ